MKNLIVSFVLFLVSLTSFGQSINSTAVLKDLKVTYLVNDSTRDEYPTKDVNVTVKVTQDSIVMVSEYPKHTVVTYKVSNSKIVENGISHFNCVDGAGGNVKVVYGSPDYNNNEVLFIVVFENENYYYTGLKQ
jgi:cytochrome c biogenesis factor